MGGAMTIDPALAFAVGGALVSVGAAWGAHTITIRMVSRSVEEARNLLHTQIESLTRRWEDANASRNEQVRELREDTAVSQSRLDVHATKLAVLEAQVGSLRAMRAVRDPKKGDS